MHQSIMKFVALAGLAVSGLAACDSTAVVDDSATVDEYNEMAIAYNDLRADVQSMPVAGTSTMPTVGSATYLGYATVLADTPSATQLIGDAEVRANFTNGTVTGTLSDFVGTVNGSDYANYSGTLALNNGTIGSGSPSALQSDLSGTLSSTTDRLTVTGGVQGNFRNNGALNAAGLTAADTTGTDFIVNGAGFEGDVGIVAIR